MRRVFAVIAVLAVLLVSACKSNSGPAPLITEAPTTNLSETAEPVGNSDDANPDPEATETTVGIVDAADAESSEADLQLSLKQTDDGFQINIGHEDAYIRDTFISPPIDGTSFAVHIVTTNVSNLESGFARYAVVVNPNTAAFDSFQLFNVFVKDAYFLDSVSEAYGFLDDRHLIYVSAINDESKEKGYFHRIEKLNILTGETTILMPEIPNVNYEDHFAPGWLNEAKDTLVLNSYTGDLWSFDLLKGEVNHLQAGIWHSWPFYMTYKSPDGELFWYDDYRNHQYRLFDHTGKELMATEVSEGYNQYPVFLWSPNGRYAANQETLDQGDHRIGDNGETYLIAPQQIRFFDRQGKLVHMEKTANDSGRYIEITGWLDDSEDLVLLREYELDRSESMNQDENRDRINSKFLLLDIASGKKLELQLQDNLEHLTEAVPARLRYASFMGMEPKVLLVDVKKQIVMVVAENGFWLSDTNENWDAWLTYEGENEVIKSIYNEFDADSGQISQTTIGSYSWDLYPVGDNWIVWEYRGIMNYIRN